MLLDLDLERAVPPAKFAVREAESLKMMLSLDRDVLAGKSVHGVLGEGLIEHREDLGGDVVHGDADQGDQVGVQWGQVLVDEVVQLGGEFYAGGPAADDGEVEEGALVVVAEVVGPARVGALLEEGEHA
ncbi:hypothetical protein MFIFM68171_10711 [Madurella fahalii]|uniref:Uncharacterized protein n=1 Tax=Madurella fahalii TaxID=1157608 RepID=A0ABQ0GRY2_9PEZI